MSFTTLRIMDSYTCHCLSFVGRAFQGLFPVHGHSKWVRTMIGAELCTTMMLGEWWLFCLFTGVLGDRAISNRSIANWLFIKNTWIDVKWPANLSKYLKMVLRRSNMTTKHGHGHPVAKNKYIRRSCSWPLGLHIKLFWEGCHWYYVFLLVMTI